MNYEFEKESLSVFGEIYFPSTGINLVNKDGGVRLYPVIAKHVKGIGGYLNIPTETWERIIREEAKKLPIEGNEFVVLEYFGGNVNVCSDEDGETKFFDTLEDATKEWEDCQNGIIVPIS